MAYKRESPDYPSAPVNKRVTKTPAYCTACGAGVVEQSNFCANCGAPVNPLERKGACVCGQVFAPEHSFCAACGRPNPAPVLPVKRPVRKRGKKIG